MELNYLVPAWHGLLNDWSYSTPQIEFDDTISHLRMLQKHHEKVGLLVTDYQPQITTKLSRQAISPDRYWSAFDYLQGINTLTGQVFDYRDFPWPANAYFDFTNFRIFVMVGSNLYAIVTFDSQGKILWINFLEGPNANSRLLFDSRGFVSRKEQDNQVTYYNPAGIWRFKHNRETDQVTINPTQHCFCESEHYDHLKDLVTEVVENQFLPQIKARDQLIVTLDDQANIPLSTYDNQHPIYSASRWHPYRDSLSQLHHGKVIADTQKRATELQSQLSTDMSVKVLPLFQSQFKLGHSQRLSQQRVAIFAEHMSAEELRSAMDIMYPRLLKNPKDEALYLFTYSPDKAGMVHQVFEQFRQDHDGEFILSMDEIDPGENHLTEEEIPPLLTIKEKRLVSNMDVLTALDKIRLLIVWGQPDQFMTMAGVSVGIPMLQNFTTEEVEDHHNGIVCHNWDDLKAGIAFYLDTLKNWNQSLVYNVQMLNRYSEDNLIATWQHILESEED